MLEIVNSIVLVVFGILFGVFYEVFDTAYFQLYEEKRKKLDRREGESYLHYLRFIFSREYIHEGIEIRKSMPKSSKWVAWGIIVLFFLLIIVLFFSPIYMNYLIFIGSFLLAIIISKLIFYLAKSGKIKVVGESFFDIPLPRKPSLDTNENQHDKIKI